jgi:hypothetical protein
MYTPNLDNIKDEIAKEIYTAILANRTIQKHTISYTWYAGSSIEVYPIDINPTSVEVYVDSGKRNYYSNAIPSIVNSNADLFCKGWFHPSDGSCPSYIVFTYSDALLKRINEKANA